MHIQRCLIDLWSYHHVYCAFSSSLNQAKWRQIYYVTTVYCEIVPMSLFNVYNTHVSKLSRIIFIDSSVK